MKILRTDVNYNIKNKWKSRQQTSVTKRNTSFQSLKNYIASDSASRADELNTERVIVPLSWAHVNFQRYLVL